MSNWGYFYTQFEMGVRRLGGTWLAVTRDERKNVQMSRRAQRLSPTSRCLFDASAEPPGAVQSACQRQLVSAALQEAVVGAARPPSAQEETLRWSPWVGTVEQVNDGSLVVTWIVSLSPALDPAANPQDWPARAEEWRLLYRNVQIQRPPPALRWLRTASPIQLPPGAAAASAVSNPNIQPSRSATFSWAFMPLLAVALNRQPSEVTLSVWRECRTAIGERLFDEAAAALQSVPGINLEEL